MEKSTFAERLNLIIKEKKIRQIDLCRKTGIGKSAMSQYLHGSFEPKQQNLYALASALDVSEAWLMGYDVPRKRKTPGAKQTDNPADIPPTCSPKNSSGTSASAGFFSFDVTDNSMESLHIPAGATAFIEKGASYAPGQIVCFSFKNSAPSLRRFYQQEDVILLAAASPGCDPIICKNADLANGILKILGVVVRVVIEM